MTKRVVDLKDVPETQLRKLMTEQKETEADDMLVQKFKYHSKSNSSSSSSKKSKDDVVGESICTPSRFSLNKLYERLLERGVMSSDHQFRKDFGRVLELKIGTFKMLIGSNLLIFYKNRAYPISLRLLSIDKRLDPFSCLDLWLDNVMHNVEETAICYHKRGIVQEYKLMRTEDMVVNEEGMKAFDPNVIKANAQNVLKFIKENCIKEGGTYWIFKDTDTNSIHLYDLSDSDEEEEGKEERKEEGDMQVVLFNKDGEGAKEPEVS